MRYFLLACLFLLMALPSANRAAPGPPPGPLAARWKKIDQLLAKDLTATAAPLVEAIYREAKAGGNAPAYVRALLYKIRLLDNRENDADERAIGLLEKDLKTATFPARPIIHSLLAGLYVDYLNQNRYRLYQRTAGAEPTAEDPANASGGADGGTALATWDVARLGSAIVRHYTRSVADEPQRQLATSLAALGDLATGGDAEGRALRPSLFDLLAHRAIAGLQNQELYIARPEQQFQPTDPALYGPAAEFAALKLTAPAADSLNGQLLALRLLQRLTAARLAATPPNAAALADVDLQRVDYLHGLAENNEPADAYEPALRQLAETYQALPISTEFTARRAGLLRETDPVAAVKLAKAAEAAYPKSRGAARARQLREGIERPEVTFKADEVVLPGQPWRLDLTLRNVPALYARAYRITRNEQAAFGPYDPQDRPFARRYARALKTAPVATWAVPLPAPPANYRERKLAVAGPALPVGAYLVVLGTQKTDPTRQGPGAAANYAVVSASGLSALSRNGFSNRKLAYLVLDRASGAPLPGVKARATFRNYNSAKRRDEWVLSPVLATDAAGEVTIPPPTEAGGQTNRMPLTKIRFWRGADTLLAENEHYDPSERNSSAETDTLVGQRQTFLFTDRAIYRPGQTLYFKGIRAENRGHKARVVAGFPVSLRLVDVNGQTVQTLEFTTSDFGTFHGSLVLPAGLLNGEMSLQTDQGNLSFAVEDYKRPTFLVMLDSVPGRPQLGQPLTINGRARAYAGPPTDGATVQYRVVRRELWLLFDGGGYGGGYGGDGRGGRGGYRPNQGGSREIAHGTATTDAEGRFSFAFVPPLVPASAGRRWEPGFVFEMTADVTDVAGETRSATRNLVIGRNPLSLRLLGPEMLDKQQPRPQPFSLFGTNATGEALPAAGTLRLLARRFGPNPPGVPGPAPTDDTDKANELPGELVKSLPFDTKNGPALDLKTVLAALPTGRYRLEAQAAAPDTAAHATLDFDLYDSAAKTLPFATPSWVRALADSVAPGQPARLLLGSSEAGARVLLEVERDGKLLRAEWLLLKPNEQQVLTLASGPAAGRGPLYIHTTQVLANRLYQSDITVQVAEKPQPLQVSLSTFRDKLQPGQRETWRLTIRQANGQPAPAELLATLYDQSLDVFRPHSLMDVDFGSVYYPALFGWQGEFDQVQALDMLEYPSGTAPTGIDYPALQTWAGVVSRSGYGMGVLQRGVARMRRKSAGTNEEQMMTSAAMAAPAPTVESDMEAADAGSAGSASAPNPAFKRPVPASDLNAVPTRADFRETALWEPALRTDKDGNAVLEFQMPEAVTRWQLLLLAHDQNLHLGRLARQLVTQKEVQISPNAPRFFRQGDTFTFPAKFSNLTDKATSGTAQLTLLDAATGQDVTSQLLRGPAQQPVAAAARQSAALGWEISLPADFAPVAVTYKVVVSAQCSVPSAQAEQGKTKRKRTTKNQKLSTKHQALSTYTDGESNTLPVLPNRLLVTESLPLPLAGAGTRTFELKKLTSTQSATRRNYSLTLEMTSNPAWYAVQSLPYLMEYPYECSEQVFSRLYANLLAAQILEANPRFKTVLAEWTRQAQSGTAAQRNALESKLAQNQELKNLLLQETPWVRDAQGETERLARLSTLFDTVRLRTETARALAKLQQMQAASGAFPWFEKMPDDRYLSQLIVAGFGKLKKLGAFDASQDEAGRLILANALRYLDNALAADYAALRRQKAVKLADNHLDDLQIQALYARSFWLDEDASSVATASKPAYAYYRQQAASFWPGRARYLQGQVALALFRADAQAPTAQQILRGLRENALHSPELGMYWKDVTGGYYWREAPAETQAALIEAFSEIKDDQQSVDEMKLWLLKQKQTQHWASTRATADACYALLLRGSDWLVASTPLQITVGAEALRPAAAQAGTGYVKTTWAAAEVQPAQGKVSITKTDPGVAWGALYWQYFEDIDQLTPAATPLSLERQLYRETRTAAGPQLEKLTPAAPLRVGDALVVRLVLRTDRALEYVHLKDQRAAGLEPIAQTSGYRYQNGLGYYESPRDAATNFFLSEVPRGTHVFEYRLRASQAGDFSGGLSQVQCLYAPEFGAHSAGGRLTIGK